MNKFRLGIVLMLVVLAAIFAAFSANALVAAIGNARMVLRTNVTVGSPSILDQTIMVQNMNPIKVNVLLQSGDDNLTPYLQVIDSNFTLDVNETKNARFTLTIPEEGMYQGRILVSFSSFEENKNETPIGLASNIIVIAKNATKSADLPNVNDTKVNDTTLLPGDQIKEEDQGIPLYLFLVIALAAFGIIIYLMRSKK